MERGDIARAAELSSPAAEDRSAFAVPLAGMEIGALLWLVC